MRFLLILLTALSLAAMNPGPLAASAASASIGCAHHTPERDHHPVPDLPDKVLCICAVCMGAAIADSDESVAVPELRSSMSVGRNEFGRDRPIKPDLPPPRA